jgi:putative tricarboxylic transport membrane protein
LKINDAVFGALLILLGIAVLVAVQGYPRIPGQNVGPSLFPGMVATVLVVCGALLVVSGIRARHDAGWLAALPWLRSPPHVARFAVIVGAVVAYILLAGSLGFLIVAPLALLAMFLAFGVRPVTAVVVALVASVLIWYAFYKLLRVPLPWGILERFAF